MRMHLTALTLTLGAIACTDRTAPTSGPMASPSLTGSLLQQIDYPSDRPYRELARVAPSHGGWYFDTITGDLTVYLKDLGEGVAARRALPEILPQALAGARRRHPQAGIVFRQGLYTFIELARWRDALDAFLGPPSVQSFGMDYARNRIVIGVLAGADRQAILAKAADVAIPAGALRFENTGPMVYRQEKTIRDSIRPVRGGIRLERPQSSDSVDVCTLGFLALWGGEHAFVTNKHCSSQTWALDSTKWYQNNAPLTHAESLSISSIGFEVADSTDFCRDGFGTIPCSYADAAVYRATLGPGDWFFKLVAKPLSGCFGSCPPPHELRYTVTDPFWSIARTEPEISVGQLVSKIGQTTGWTQGFVLFINRKVIAPGGSGWWLDQAYADYADSTGDSGAPVLLELGVDSTATLGGIHSGVVVGGPNDGLAIFSLWSGILRMYPGLRVH